MKKIDLIQPGWNLFLDRDGVINVDKEGDYVYHIEEFKFCPGALEAIRFFNGYFNRIIVVTNQKGVGKGLMTENDLLGIHRYMQQEVEAAGGRIDRIFYSTALNNEAADRKPNTGMAEKASEVFPGLDFRQSLMIGNNLSDMEFGRRANMHTVMILSTLRDLSLPHPSIDFAFDSLYDFAKALGLR